MVRVTLGPVYDALEVPRTKTMRQALRHNSDDMHHGAAGRIPRSRAYKRGRGQEHQMKFALIDMRDLGRIELSSHVPESLEEEGSENCALSSETTDAQVEARG